MALQGYFVAEDGGEHPVAYARIVGLNLDWLDERGLVVAHIYHDAAYRQAKRPPVARRLYEFLPAPVVDESNGALLMPSFSQLMDLMHLDQAGVNPLSQAYELMAAMPEWAGWEQV